MYACTYIYICIQDVEFTCVRVIRPQSNLLKNCPKWFWQNLLKFFIHYALQNLYYARIMHAHTLITQYCGISIHFILTALLNTIYWKIFDAQDF